MGWIDFERALKRSLAAEELRRAWEAYVKTRDEFVRLDGIYREHYARYEEPGIIGGNPDEPTRKTSADMAHLVMCAAKENVHKYVARMFGDEVDGDE